MNAVMNLKLVRLSEISLADIIALHNDSRVLRHLPLAVGGFDAHQCQQWVESKEAQWQTNGYGPWGILINDEFAGWGGLQKEMGEADLGLVLSPDYWGYGKRICQKIIEIAFEQMNLASVTALLPPSRSCTNGMLRFGFQPDGQVEVSGTIFLRFRLLAPRQVVAVTAQPIIPPDLAHKAAHSR
ncbi:hypothetical protein BJL95_16530 [Methylomonas sp. LWB]|uniref:GNAT family N-acetyltransferase n=1 Tax=Methylomonas sp. LWB TaxID=1905845 RepID=UPI0008DAAAE9|nr:GNAT family protein [Methylomonas sp. LWB]OHX35016.1 hypothetical protein BJL95_16530 [Methylomonas sp. LWB]